MSNPYASDKVQYFQDRLQELREGRQPNPVHVQMILSDLCNQNCSFCAYRMDGYSSNQLFSILEPDGTKNNNPNRMIPYEKAIEILNDCKELGVRAIQFTGGGEPTVHPKHREIFAHTQALGLDWAVVTNGMLFRDGVVDLLAAAAWVRISLDAGTDESYVAIREAPKGTYRRVLDNIQALRKRRDELKSKLVIGVGYVVTKDNWREVLQGARNAKESGADNVRISGIFQNDGIAYFDGFYDEAVELVRQAEALSDDSFSVFNRFDARTQDLEQANPDYEFCGQQHFTTYIGGDQNVYRCCVLAYNDRGKIGSIKEQSFKDLWSSRSKQADFHTFDARDCERCMFNDKNRAILYQIENPPQHASFT